MSRRSDIAGRVFSRLSAAGLAEASTLCRRDTATEIPITAVLRQSVERQGADGLVYLQSEITALASEVGRLGRGDRITIDGASWICDEPSKSNGYTVAFFVIPDLP